MDEIVVELNPLSPFLKTTISSVVGSLYFVVLGRRNHVQIPFDTSSNPWDFSSGYLNVAIHQCDKE